MFVCSTAAAASAGAIGTFPAVLLLLLQVLLLLLLLELRAQFLLLPLELLEHTPLVQPASVASAALMVPHLWL
jgi:hypothetical protein